jgi:hypothetical protein
MFDYSSMHANHAMAASMRMSRKTRHTCLCHRALAFEPFTLLLQVCSLKLHTSN